MMRIVFFFACAGTLLVPLVTCGQTTVCDSVYTIADEMPKFGKSDEDFTLYLAKNLSFGKCGLDEMKILTWTINTEGYMTSIDVPSLEGQCKEAVIGQLKKFPKWTPGRQKGKLVCVKIILRMCIKTG